MNYHKDTSYLLEPEQLQSPSKDHLNGFETAYGLQVNDEEKGEPVLMQRFWKRIPFKLETVTIHVEENGRRINYEAVQKALIPKPAPIVQLQPFSPKLARADYPVLPPWAERYRPEIQPLWRTESEQCALRTPQNLYEKFVRFLIERDFLGAEATLAYLKSGTEGTLPASTNPSKPPGTRQKRRKKTRQKPSTWSTPLSPEAKHLFETYWHQAQSDPEYLRQREALCVDR